MSLISYPLTLIMRSEISKRPKVIIERGVEYEFALRMINKYCNGKILDIGTGQTSWPHLLSISGYDVTASDMKVGWNHHFNRHYPVIKDDITKSKIKDKYQFITCISTIEHITDRRTAINNMKSLLQPGGYLLLTFPYNEHYYYQDVYQGECDFKTSQLNKLYLEELNIGKAVSTEIYKVFISEKWGNGDRIRPRLDPKGNLMCILYQA